MNFNSVESAFQEAVAQGVFPGAVVLVGKGREVVYEQAFGCRALLPDKSPMKVETIFDVASLTKPLATTVAIMLLVREKKIRLDDQVTRVIPMYGVLGKSLTTFRQLLNHSAGLPAWKPFFEDIIKSEKSGRINFVAQCLLTALVLAYQSGAVAFGCIGAHCQPVGFFQAGIDRQ